MLLQKNISVMAITSSLKVFSVTKKFRCKKKFSRRNKIVAETIFRDENISLQKTVLATKSYCQRNNLQQKKWLRCKKDFL